MHQFRMYCQDEDQHIMSGWVNHAPAFCPNDSNHTLDSNLTSQINTRDLDSYEKITHEFESCLFGSAVFTSTKEGIESSIFRNSSRNLVLKSGDGAEQYVCLKYATVPYSIAKKGLFLAKLKRNEQIDAYGEWGFLSQDEADFIGFFAEDTGNFKCKTKVGGSETMSDSGITLDLNSHDFAVSMQPDSVQFLIDGTIVATHTDDLSSQALCPYVFQKTTGGSATKELQLKKIMLQGEF